MRILVVSDSHGNENGILEAYQAVRPVDMIIHCGDGEADAWVLEAAESLPVLRVAGNCDVGSRSPRELVSEWKGKRILICHGDRYGVKTGLSFLAARGRELAADAVLFGHTHHALAETDQGLLLLNPGTLFGRASFRSCALLEITDAGLQATIHPLP
ncbi:metallophosphoesterase family protein [Trichlorobacter ammonificans]|uniref:Phosphoesterase n=1 Tax=Trichlorobacter ammonificans TaxID=2916410 RepID=A0ABN8HHM3_9BACT|nr:metallophosphoesterase [Trichlorobacter ammonificans]CAH2030683.1 Phosphoesterase [Trichlorobacter ammonificans]